LWCLKIDSGLKSFDTFSVDKEKGFLNRIKWAARDKGQKEGEEKHQILWIIDHKLFSAGCCGAPALMYTVSVPISTVIK